MCKRSAATTTEVSYLEPFPARLLCQLRAGDSDPAAIGDRRESVALAFIAALQLLPATQRPALILPDELAWPSQAEACPAVDSHGAAARHAILWVSCGRHVW